VRVTRRAQKYFPAQRAGVDAVRAPRRLRLSKQFTAGAKARSDGQKLALARLRSSKEHRAQAPSAVEVGLGRTCRFAPPRVHFIPDSLPYSAPLFLRRQRDRTPGSCRRLIGPLLTIAKGY
jgi:hypothetical protein